MWRSFKDGWVEKINPTYPILINTYCEEESKMDFRKLGNYIYWLGAVIAVVGGLYSIDEWEMGIRGQAFITAVVGLIIVFIGSAIRASAKKEK